MQLARLILWRLILGFITLVLVSLLVFVTTNLLPGDPATAILGKSATPESLAYLREELGLNRPIMVRYAVWLRDMATGNLGTSYVGMRQPVSELISGRLYNSFVLASLAAVMSVPLALGIGAYVALKRDSLFDHFTNLTVIVLGALPEFVIGITVILLLATQVLHVLPPVSRLDRSISIWNQIDLLILPTITLTLAVVPYIIRMMRASTIEVLESDYIVMARLKGLPERLVMRRHTMPNAIVPAIQATAISLAWLAGGIVVVEYVFAYPGIGSALVDAVANRNYSILQVLSLILAITYVLLNLIADILTILITPRLRTGLR